jgi:pilus assembly protein CpaE
MMHPANDTITVAIAEADPDHLARLRVLLLQDRHVRIIATATDRNQTFTLAEAAPDICLLSTTVAPRDSLILVRQLLDLAPDMQVLLVTELGDGVDVASAMLAGVRGILYKPLDPEDVLNTVRDVVGSEFARRQRFNDQARARAPKTAQGEMTVVFSPKGGVGCTLIATNLAIALARSTHKRVALVDYSLQFGTIGTQLNLHSTHTLSELLPHASSIDRGILDEVLVAHSSGVHVLLPPVMLEQVEGITTESLVNILEALRANYDYVVVDTWHAVEDATLAIMELADHLLVVTTPEIPALSTMRRFLDFLGRYPQLREKPQLVVNRHPSKGGLPLAELERSLGLSALATIPSDGQVMTLASNEGVPVSQTNGNSAAARNLTRLAEELVGTPTPAAPPAPAHRLSLNWRRS